jgi:hypothetical protein
MTVGQRWEPIVSAKALIRTSVTSRNDSVVLYTFCG